MVSFIFTSIIVLLLVVGARRSPSNPPVCYWFLIPVLQSMHEYWNCVPFLKNHIFWSHHGLTVLSLFLSTTRALLLSFVFGYIFNSVYVIFYLPIHFIRFSQQVYWGGLPFPPPKDHILSELSTMTCPYWVALHGMTHSFIDFCKPLRHNKAVIHEGHHRRWWRTGRPGMLESVGVTKSWTRLRN